MTAAVTTVPIQAPSARWAARLAGLLYVVAVATAVFAEFIAPGRLGTTAAIAIPVACYAGVTILLFAVLRPVNQPFALVALVFGLAGLAFEALRWQPQGVNVAMVSHGLFCLAVGYLFFRSTLVPRVFGVLMGCAGLVWLIYVDAPFAESLTPWNSFVGLLCEAAPMVWLLIIGIGPRRN